MSVDPDSTKPMRAVLAAKMVAARQSISHIAKGGTNEAQHYEFVTDADVMAAVRKALDEQGIATVVSIHDITSLPFETKSNSKQFLVTVQGEVEFIDSTTGESFVAFGVGQGADSMDKGVYKAITGLVKYVLLKTLLVPTGDDPEVETEADGEPKKRAPRAVKNLGNPDNAINDKQRAMLQARINESGLEGQQRVAFLIESTGKGSTKLLTNADLDKALERLKDKDLVAELIATIKAENETEETA